jgi:hypothetical protein
MDRRTGRLTESVNDVTKNLGLHDPLIRRRIDDVLAADAAHGPYHYNPANPGDSGATLHPSVPGTHAETFSTSQALTYRRGERLPVSDQVLRNGEIVVDVQNISRSAPRPFGCCANCTRILRDVPSASGKYATFPHGGNLTDVWTGP